MKAKPDNLGVFRERTLSRLKRRAPLGRLALLLWDAVPHPAKGAFLKKRPLEPSKTFFRGVKAKPDGLSVFRAETLSRLKRRAPTGWLSHSLWDAVPHPAKERF